MKTTGRILLITAGVICLSSCGTDMTVSYQRDVYPILKNNCHSCHVQPAGRGYQAVGLSMENYENLMRGTMYGPVVMPGDSQRSILIMLVEGRADLSMRMPHLSDEPLRPDEIAVLTQWVDQGAKDN